MLLSYHADDLQSLIKGWIEQEHKGEKFPVPFDVAWQIAGYSRKSTAKRRLASFIEGEDFCTALCKSTGGRASEDIRLTCDAMKHLCLMAETESGRQVRQYFIEAEKKWQMVQQVAPSFASEIELLHAQAQLAQIEREKMQIEREKMALEIQLLDRRTFIAQHLPEPIQRKILGYDVIKETEVIERVVDSSTGRTYEGVGITYVTKALGFKSNKECWAWLESVGYGKNSDHWKAELYAGTNYHLSRDDLQYLKDILPRHGNRQMWMGEDE